MTDLSPEAQRILDLTRAARTPSMDDRLRIARVLSRSVGLATLASASQSSGSALAKPTLTALSLKWVTLAVPVLVIAAAYSFGRPAAPNTGPKPVAALTPASPPVPSASGPVEAPATATAAVVSSEETVIPNPTRTARPERKARREVLEDTLNVELDLLHEAQAAWRRGDGARALALTLEHRQRFPKSALAAEREALRVLSLCASGRTAEAKASARRVFHLVERSPLRAAVERSCIKD